MHQRITIKLKCDSNCIYVNNKKKLTIADDGIIQVECSPEHSLNLGAIEIMPYEEPNDVIHITAMEIIKYLSDMKCDPRFCYRSVIRKKFHLHQGSIDRALIWLRAKNYIVAKEGIDKLRKTLVLTPAGILALERERCKSLDREE